MQININTDKTIERHKGLDDHVESVVQAAIARFGEHITRVEVHLSPTTTARNRPTAATAACSRRASPATSRSP